MNSLSRSSPPERVGKYTILDILGEGGMATVYRARLHGLARATKDVALKVIHPHLNTEREFMLMFLDEMRVGMALSHRNIVQTFDVGKTPQCYFLVMELIDGKSLSDLQHDGLGPSGRCLPLDLALFVGIEICSALSYAHSFVSRITGQQPGVVHRDVSPSNILLSRYGDVKLADFGIAKATGRLSVSSARLIKGKQRYMAPEQARGSAEPRSDLYSLGAVLYEVLVGPSERNYLDDRLASGKTLPPLAEVAEGQPISDSLSQLIHSCLSQELEQRPPSAEVLRQGLADELFRLQLTMKQRLDPHERLRGLIERYDDRESASSSKPPSTENIVNAILVEARKIVTKSIHSKKDSLKTLSAGQKNQTQLMSFSKPADASTEAGTSFSLLLAKPYSKRARVKLLVTIGVLVIGVLLGWLWLRQDSSPRAPIGRTLTKVTARRNDQTQGTKRSIATPKHKLMLLGPKPDAAGRGADQGLEAQSVKVEKTSPTKRSPTIQRRRRRRYRPAATKKEPGYLHLNAIPWAKVYIDRRYRGVTPLQNLKLRPGSHSIRLLNPDQHLNRMFIIHLSSGQTLKRVVYLRKK